MMKKLNIKKSRIFFLIGILTIFFFTALPIYLVSAQDSSDSGNRVMVLGIEINGTGLVSDNSTIYDEHPSFIFNNYSTRVVEVFTSRSFDTYMDLNHSSPNIANFTIKFLSSTDEEIASQYLLAPRLYGSSFNELNITSFEDLGRVSFASVMYPHFTFIPGSKIKIFYQNKLIYSSTISHFFCNNNGVCENSAVGFNNMSENYETCPADCGRFMQDGICDVSVDSSYSYNDHYCDPDCASDVSTDGNYEIDCFKPNCNDKIKNQDETEVDCGGSNCLPCSCKDYDNTDTYFIMSIFNSSRVYDDGKFYSDVCESSTTLREYSCGLPFYDPFGLFFSVRLESEIVECNSGCENGACLGDCYNGIWDSNLGELGIDCGGPCPSVDGNGCSANLFLDANLGELGVDCGALPLRSCSNNGVIDTLAGEQGIDCGPWPLVSCSNNKVLDPLAGEVGIDCGPALGRDCCSNGFLDANLKEKGIDCGGSCVSCECSDADANLSLNQSFNFLSYATYFRVRHNDTCLNETSLREYTCKEGALNSMVVGCNPGFASGCYNGACRIYNPIGTCEDLQNIKNNPNGSYYLVNDVDCSDTKTWNCANGTCLGFQPIYNFAGVLDGRYYRIINLYSKVNGLIGNSRDFTVIRRLGLENVNISGWPEVGGLVGVIGRGTDFLIDEVYLTGTVNLFSNIPYSYVGGFVGRSYISQTKNPVIKNSYVNLNSNIGTGLIGMTLDTHFVITNSYAIGAFPLSLGARYLAPTNSYSSSMFNNVTPASSYYTKNNAPLSSWDFNNTWQENLNTFPTLKGFSLTRELPVAPEQPKKAV